MTSKTNKIQNQQENNLDENSEEKIFKLEIVWQNVAIFILLHYWAAQILWNWQWTHFWFREFVTKFYFNFNKKKVLFFFSIFKIIQGVEHIQCNFYHLIKIFEFLQYNKKIS